MITFRALTTAVSVSIDDTLPLAEVAKAMLSTYPRADSAELEYVLDPTGVRVGSTFLPVEQPVDVVPAFEMNLYEQVIARAKPGWILHAAALEVGGRALVLCGASGAGKTTLTLALTARGFRLLTEEVVWISDDGMVCGLPRPLHVPEGNPQGARIPSTWGRFDYPLRDHDGVQRTNALAIPPPEVFVHDPLPLSGIVRMGHGPDWPVQLRASTPGEALERLWDRALRNDSRDLEVATQVLRRHPSYSLSSTTEQEALALLEPLLK